MSTSFGIGFVRSIAPSLQPLQSRLSDARDHCPHTRDFNDGKGQGGQPGIQVQATIWIPYNSSNPDSYTLASAIILCETIELLLADRARPAFDHEVQRRRKT